MKKNQMKNKLKIFSLIAFLCCCLCFGQLFFSAKQKNNLAIGLNSNVSSTEVITNALVTQLKLDESVIENEYNLSKKYPLIAENQTTSNLCWIYSSSKVLESSLMVQKNEYVNLSETAIAYLAYKHHMTGDPNLLNSSGEFETFSNTIKTHGVVFESDFSNDKFFDMTEQNIEGYSYIDGFADKSLASEVSIVNISDCEEFKNLDDLELKKNLLKRYIQKYGALFVGLEKGVIKGSDPFYYDNDEMVEGEKIPINQKHAVAIIGWNEVDGFIALNSWGTKASQFYIPYNYMYMYEDLHGFLVKDSKIKIISTSAETFDTKIGYNANLYNVFCHNETISLKYEVNDYNFEQTRIEICKGGENVTDNFAVGYYDESSQVKITYNTTPDFFVGGDYVIRFYEADKLIGSKTFFVVTGTELTYFKLSTTTTDGVDKTESELLLSGYISSTNSVTYYLSPTGNNYQLDFSLLDFNKWSKTHKELDYTISEPYVYFYSGTSTVVSQPADNLMLVKKSGNICDVSNNYNITISGLSNYVGHLITFKINIKSNIVGWEVISREYFVNIFVSNQLLIETSNAYSISYNLNGGNNSSLNVDRFPNYDLEQSKQTMTDVLLFNPTKNGQDFLGWFLEPNFVTEIKAINMMFKRDIAVYAKWQKIEDVPYYSAELVVGSVLDYYGNEKQVQNNQLIYGDSIIINYNFTPTQELSKYDAINISVDYYLNDSFVEKHNLENANKQIIKNLGFGTQSLGEYKVTMKLTLIISHSRTIFDSEEIEFSIIPKTITPVFSNLECDYDKKEHKPTISCLQGDIFPEDVALFKIWFNEASHINAGEYEYNDIKINNSNYKLNQSDSCILVINKLPLNVTWSKTKAVYNGFPQKPTYVVNGLLDGDNVTLVFSNEEMIDADTYEVGINQNSLIDGNYYLKIVEPCDFVIEKAKITIKIQNVRDRVETATQYRKPIENAFTVEGNYYCTLEELKITLQSEGLTADVNGLYEITGICENSNYEATFENGVYTILGFYYVYYTLPNGEVYIEMVDEGKTPKGITKDIYKTSIFEKIIYSDKLESNGNDIHVVVTVKSYLALVLICTVVLVFTIIAFIIYKHQNKNKVG